MRHIRLELEQLEHRAAALLDDQAFVTVTFSNGTRRTMRLASVIDLLREGEQPRVIDVQGEERTGDGQLLQLIQGIARGEA
ncbi:MAG: hypothetical protein E7425_01060 [Ruminococcaceae bacterium]|nr:hypothetical protein [Oscillospiraceae bacterium]